MHTADNTLIKPIQLVDENGNFKERTSLSEIAEYWAKESGFNSNDICRALFNKARDGKLGYHPFSHVGSNIETVTFNGKDFHVSDLHDYLDYIYSCIRERLIYQLLSGGQLKPVDYAKVLSNFNNIPWDNFKIEERNKITAEQGLLICDNMTLSEAAYFQTWFHSLSKELQTFINISSQSPEDSYYRATIPIPLQAVKGMISSHYTQGLIKHINTYDNWRLEFIVEETREPLKPIINRFCTSYTEEKISFNHALSKHIHLSRKSFLRWLRRINPMERALLPEGAPIFWGDNVWENQPESYEPENENAPEYSLYNAIRFWSDPDDIYNLETSYKDIPAFRNPNNRNFNYLLLEDTKHIQAVVYNTKLEEIYSKFLEHFQNGRLEMRGFIHNPNEREVIKYDTIQGMIDSNVLYFNDSRGKSGYIDITGIRVYKVNKNSVSIDLRSGQEKESTEQVRLSKIEKLIPLVIAECKSQKVFPSRKGTFASNLNKFAIAANEWKDGDYAVTTIATDLGKHFRWETDIKPTFKIAKKPSQENPKKNPI